MDGDQIARLNSRLSMSAMTYSFCFLTWEVDGDMLTSSPRLKPGDSPSHLEAFLLRRVVPGSAFTAPGLTDSPQAVTASPTASQAKQFFETERLRLPLWFLMQQTRPRSLPSLVA